MTGVRFSTVELRDLAVAWVALGVAFTFFLDRRLLVLARVEPDLFLSAFLPSLAVNLATVGVAFLLHELAHKVVAVGFGQVAEFRADFGMLFLAVMGGLAGFLFAAPGAVYHRGDVTRRENGLIALAGPVTNLALAVPFAALWLAPVGGSLTYVGRLGVWINLLLAGFNMLPFGPLDGATVWKWSKAVFVAVFVPSAALALLVLTGYGGVFG